MEIETATVVIYATIPSTVPQIRTSGYYYPADGGGSEYRRVATGTAPPPPGTLISADGAWWQYVPQDGVTNVRGFGAHGNFDPSIGTGTDDAAVIQAAMNFAGISEVYFPRGRYLVGTTLEVPGGQTLTGAGFVTNTGHDTKILGGSVLVNGINAPLLRIAGGDASTTKERCTVRHLALEQVNYQGGNTVGIELRFGQYHNIMDIYIVGFGKGISVNEWIWLSTYSRVQIFSCGIGFFLNSGGEDSVFTSCIVRGYASNAVGVDLNYHSQTNIFIGCDFSDCGIGARLNNGHDQNGQPFSVHATFINCQFEKSWNYVDVNSAGIVIVSSNDAVAGYPSVIVQGCRFLAKDTRPEGAPILPFVRAEAANSIRIEGQRGSGYDYLIYVSDATKIGSISATDCTSSYRIQRDGGNATLVSNYYKRFAP